MSDMQKVVVREHTPAELSTARVQPDRRASYVCSDDDHAGYETLELKADWEEHCSDEGSIITADDLIQQLATAADPNTVAVLLQRITHSHCSIAGCRTWHQLLLLLPNFLHHAAAHGIIGSNADVRSHPASIETIPTAEDGHHPHGDQAPGIAEAVEQLILQKLAPEVLDCSPEPLAEVLIALLTASCQQPAAAHAAVLHCDHLQPQHSNISSYRGDITPHSTLSNSAVQLLVVGLHKIARQWHFLDQQLSQQLSHAVVGVLLAPLQLMSSSSKGHSTTMQPSDQQHEEPQAHLQTENVSQAGQPAMQQQQQPKQQHVCCCLAEQLVLADASMGWLHRLNACSSSGRPLRAAMASRDLAGHLMSWLEASTASMKPEKAGMDRKSGSPQQQCGSSSSSMLRQSSSWAAQLSQHQVQNCNCVIDQLLSTLLETPSGRRLLIDPHQDAAQLQCSDIAPGNSKPDCIDAPQQQTQSSSDLLSAAMSRMHVVCGSQCQGDKECDAAAVSAAAEAAQLAIRAVQQQEAEPLNS